MDNLLKNGLQVKQDCFKKLSQMVLFSNMDESIPMPEIPLFKFKIA